MVEGHHESSSRVHIEPQLWHQWKLKTLAIGNHKTWSRALAEDRLHSDLDVKSVR
jgi:hypothetical protein